MSSVFSVDSVVQHLAVTKRFTKKVGWEYFII